MSAEVRLGLIGAGRIGKLHALNVRDIAGCRLTAIADVNQDAARSCGDTLGVSNIHTDAQRVLSDPEVDAVLICSATDTHAHLIEEAARANKHIFCEKPIALSLEPIDKALAAVAESQVKLQVGFNRRFDPSFRAVKEADVGEIHIIRITSRDPEPPPIAYVQVSGGLFLDMAIHDFDLARHLAGSEVTSVFAVGANRIDPAIGEAGDIDTAVTTLTFESGALATIDNSRQAPYGYDQRVEVFGAEGMAVARNTPEHGAQIFRRQGIEGAVLQNFFTERYAAAYRAELSSFIQCIQEDTDPEVTGADGRAPVQIALAAQQSLLEGQPVAL